ncbi:Hypothetical protein CINCED_3A023337 [Cinara cedri]|nr:Hypothetical protein CINCED_3A023337 [Cinara cedri]
MKNKDHSDKKYDNCKCFGPCIAKEIGTMDPETGKWNWAKLKEMSNLLTDQTLINEAKNMEAHCFDETNTHCEAGYAMLKCALENSQMTKDMVKSYVATKEESEKNQGDE